MKSLLTAIIAMMVALTTAAQAPAFPGAEGHGRYVTGGRGGNVVHVTNLNDSGTGSLREAVKGTSKKIVVFDVGGVIPLASDLTIGENTTIEGQTAPYPGITIRYYTVRPSSNNIIRFIRIRRGQEKDVNDGADAIWQRQVTGVILDHCSFSWCIDEVASFYDNNNFTMQWCTIAESLTNAGHNKGAHGFGGIWGGKLASFHHNLLQHLQNRTPRFNGARYQWGGYTNNKEYNTYQWENYVQAENVDFRNCVLYNWGNGNGCYGGPGGGQINIVNNYYKAGPATSNKTRVTQISVAEAGNIDSDKYTSRKVLLGMTSRYFINGNYVTAAGSNAANYDWSGVLFDNGTYTINGEKYSKDPNHFYGSQVTYKQNSNGEDCVRIKLDSPAPTGEVTTHSAVNAYNKVLDFAGASMYRDNVDERYATEARNGTATYRGSVTGQQGIIDLVSDVNGYTETNFGTGSLPDGWDSDNDGMPDIWETANGLNPNSATDATTYTLDTKGYYTNIEVYCNALVEELMKEENKDAESAVNEYYPSVVYVKGVPYYGENGNENGDDEEVETYTIAQSTHTTDISETEWGFENNITISNGNGKSYMTGNEDGIKYSAGVQYTIHLPEGAKVTAITFKGYDNYAEADSYIAECNGTTFTSSDYVFPKKNGSTYTVAEKTLTLSSPASGTITFTPAGKQVVWVITLTLAPTIKEAEYIIAQDTHTSNISETEWAFSDNITVSNDSGKSYMTGFENGIKYSAGVQYTVHLPENFHVSEATFKGYDNYADADSYIAECNGVDYTASDYVFPKKNGSNYTVTEKTIAFNKSVSDTFTFTPGGKQVVWVITLKGTIGEEEQPHLRGDANMDNEVDVTDVMLIVSYVLHRDPEIFSFTNSDVNGDKEVNVTDIMTVVNIIIYNE